jgi:hypothetical protein
MSLTDMKKTILDTYHKDINYWWRLLGEMFEGTENFTKQYSIRCILNNGVCYVTWNDHSWEIRKL